MRRIWSRVDGAEALEFAIIAPVLIILLLMIIEGALLFNTWLGINHATREAARYGIGGAQVDAATPPSVAGLITATYNQAQTLVHQFAAVSLGQCASGGTANCIAVAVQTDPSTGYPTQVTVTTYYTVSTITPMIQALVPTVPLVAQAAMRAE